MPSNAIEEIHHLFTTYGSLQLGENCSQLQHAAQCAALAELSNSGDALIAAAFLHDIGHLYAIDMKMPEVDSEGHFKHEEIGAELLQRWGFPASVSEPVNLHVKAKRFLATHDEEYGNTLSKASRKTLSQQGNKMNKEEQKLFIEHPYASDALTLRQWDDAGKVPNLKIAPLDHWLEICNHVLHPNRDFPLSHVELNGGSNV